MQKISSGMVVTAKILEKFCQSAKIFLEFQTGI